MPNCHQADGTAIPSVASALIDELPTEDSPNREDEETVARDVAAVSYLGQETRVLFCILLHES